VDSQLDRAQAPIRDQIMTLAAQGKKDEALAMLGANQGMRNQAEVTKAILAGERDLTKWGWEKQRFDNDQTKFRWEGTNQAQREALHPLEIAQRRASIAAQNEQAAAARSNRAWTDTQREAQVAGARAAATLQQLGQQGNVYTEGVFNPSDSVALNKLALEAGIKDGDARAAIMKRLASLGGEMEVDYATEGDDGKPVVSKKKIPIPTSLVKQALLSASGGYLWDTDADWADSAEKNLRAALKQVKEVGFKVDGKTEMWNQNKSVDDFVTWDRAMNGVLENPQTQGKRGR
jgi:hypothetical protein